MKTRNIITIALLIILIFIWSVYFFRQEGQTTSLCGNYSQKEIIIGGEVIKADIADDDCKRSLGLSGRKYLENNQGMLFIFEKEGNYGFWMNDMSFTIDIIWIDGGLNVTGVEKNLSPKTFPMVFGQNYVARYVLELPAGYISKNDIMVGNKINFSETAR